MPGSAGGYSGRQTVYDVMGRVVRASNPTAMTNAWELADEDPTSFTEPDAFGSEDDVRAREAALIPEWLFLPHCRYEGGIRIDFSLQIFWKPRLIPNTA